MRDIGANIRRARTRRRLTQDDLAQTVHTTRQTISNYETSRSRPDVETLQRLADALGVELTELLDGAPSADARRAALRRLCIMGAVTLVLAGLWAYLHAVCLRQYQHGDMTPLAAMLITEPLLLCALAWTLLQALRMVTRLRPRCHGSAVFSPRRAALADAAGHRTVKLHKPHRQKFASAGFLPFSAQKCHAALHFTDRRGILFSLEKHMSAYRGQFSSDLK